MTLQPQHLTARAHRLMEPGRDSLELTDTRPVDSADHQTLRSDRLLFGYKTAARVLRHWGLRCRFSKKLLFLGGGGSASYLVENVSGKGNFGSWLRSPVMFWLCNHIRSTNILTYTVFVM